MSQPSHKKPIPPALGKAAQRPRCPICGMPAYSRSGTHPQCSQTAQDRLLRAAAKPPLAVTPAATPPVPPAAG